MPATVAPHKTRIDVPPAARDRLVPLLNDLGDPTTADLFTEISRSLDKDLWFLEAHLQGRQER